MARMVMVVVVAALWVAAPAAADPLADAAACVQVPDPLDPNLSCAVDAGAAGADCRKETPQDYRWDTTNGCRLTAGARTINVERCREVGESYYGGTVTDRDCATGTGGVRCLKDDYQQIDQFSEYRTDRRCIVALGGVRAECADTAYSEYVVYGRRQSCSVDAGAADVACTDRQGYSLTAGQYASRDCVAAVEGVARCTQAVPRNAARLTTVAPPVCRRR